MLVSSLIHNGGMVGTVVRSLPSNPAQKQKLEISTGSKKMIVKGLALLLLLFAFNKIKAKFYIFRAIKIP